MARWLSWLERRPVRRSVDGSIIPGRLHLCNTIYTSWGLSSAGRASALTSRGSHVLSPVGPICYIKVWWNRQTQGISPPRTYHPCRFKSGHPFKNKNRSLNLRERFFLDHVGMAELADAPDLVCRRSAGSESFYPQER